MAASPLVSGKRFHARSVSLPSETHSVIHEYDEILTRLSSSGAARSSSSSFTNHLNGLQDLHDCLDSVLSLPETHQALAKDCNGKWVAELRDGSLTLLDVCRTTRDSRLITKKCIQKLQSSFRRRGSDLKESAKYLACREVVKELIRKALKNLKGLLVVNKGHDSLFVVFMLREVEQVTLSVLESLLSSVSGPKNQTLVSMLMHPKLTNCETANEFDKTEAAVQYIVKNKADGVENIHARLADVELSNEDLEFAVGSLNKHLLRTRLYPCLLVVLPFMCCVYLV